MQEGQERLEGQLLGIVSLSTETSRQVTDIKGEWLAQQQQIQRFKKELAAQMNDLLEDGVHEAIFPDRQTKMVLLGVSGAASEEPKRRLTNILADVDCKVDLLYAYRKTPSARTEDQQQQQPVQKYNIPFEVRPQDLPAIYRVKGALRDRGYNLQQQMHPKELQRKADLQKMPNFRAALAVELAKPPQARAIIWELDRCKMGKGEAATVWTLRRAERWEAEEAAAAAAAAAADTGSSGEEEEEEELVSNRVLQQQQRKQPQAAAQQPDAPPPKDGPADQSSKHAQTPAFAEPAAIAAAAAAASKGTNTSRKPIGSFAAVAGGGVPKRTGAGAPPSSSLPPSRSSGRAGTAQQSGHYRAMANGAGGGQSGGAGNGGEVGGGTGKSKGERKGRGGVQSGS